MIRRPPRSTPLYSSAASDVYKRQQGGIRGRAVGEPGRGGRTGRGGGCPPALLDGRRVEPRRGLVVGRPVPAGGSPPVRGADAPGARAGRAVRRRGSPRVFRRLRGGAPRGDGGIRRAGAASYGAGDGAVRGEEDFAAGHLRRDGVGPDPGPEGVPGPPRPRARLRRAVGGAGAPDLSLIHISEPTRLRRISYAVF